VCAPGQVSAKDDVNISGIFQELLTQARLQLDWAEATAQDDDDDAGSSGPQPSSPPPPAAAPPELRRRRVGSDGLQRLRTKRASCHVS